MLTIPLPVIDGRPVMPGREPQISPRHASGPQARNPVARVSSALRDPAYRGSYALVANTLGTNLIGAAYWAVAARLYGPEALGRATALISGLMLVAILSQLNLGSTLMRFLPQMGARSAGRLIIFSYLATSLTAVAGSVIFVTVLPRLSSEWHFVGGSTFLAVLFAVSVVVWETFTLQDAVLVGLQHAVVVPVENVIYALAKLALLVVAARLLGSTDILLSWISPLILLIPVINWLIFRYLKDRSPHNTVPGMRLRRLARFASVDYMGAIGSQITANVLPLLVISVLGPTASGSFYIASLITSGVASLGVSFSTGLLVEAAAAPDRLAGAHPGCAQEMRTGHGPGDDCAGIRSTPHPEGLRGQLHRPHDRALPVAVLDPSSLLHFDHRFLARPYRRQAHSRDDEPARHSGSHARRQLDPVRAARAQRRGRRVHRGRFRHSTRASPHGPGRPPAAARCDSAAGQRTIPAGGSAGFPRSRPLGPALQSPELCGPSPGDRAGRELISGPAAGARASPAAASAPIRRAAARTRAASGKRA